jgi:Protein of unknown function (DUF1236)
MGVSELSDVVVNSSEEAFMGNRLLYCAIAVAAFAGANGVIAQNSNNMNAKPNTGATLSAPTAASSQLSLTAQQKQAIWDSVGKAKGANAPANFQASVGASVPAQIALRSLPSDILQQVPNAKKYRYAKIADEVLLVDPTNHKVIDIIKQ